MSATATLAPAISGTVPVSDNPAAVLYAETIQKYTRDPEGFVRDVIGVVPDPWQREVLRAIRKGELRLAIRSGHGVGKSALLAWLAIWFLCCKFPCKVVMTAPSAPQLYDALVAELKTWIQQLPIGWRQLLNVSTDRVTLSSSPDEAFVSARTSRAESPEALAGVHSKYVLLIVDEASGVPQSVFEAAGGSMSSIGAITILTGNPTRNSGYFFNAFNQDADRWFRLRVNSAESKRVDPNYIKEMAERYGINSNQYRVRVLGEFPTTDDDSLISALLVDEAMRREPNPDPLIPTVWGLDSARFGADASVLVKRNGYTVLEPPRRWVSLDTMQLAGAVKHEWDSIHASARPNVIAVDIIGIGAGVADRLREQNLPVLDVNVSEQPSSKLRFLRLRDELWDNGKTWLESRRASLPFDDRLREDLVSVRYTYDSAGRLAVESKASMRTRGLRSPDSADAFLLTLAPGAMTSTVTALIKWQKPLKRMILGAS